MAEGSNRFPAPIPVDFERVGDQKWKSKPPDQRARDKSGQIVMPIKINRTQAHSSFSDEIC